MSIRTRGKKGIYWCDFYSVRTGKRIRKSLNTTDKDIAVKAEAKLLLLDDESDSEQQDVSITLEGAYRHAMRARAGWRSAKDKIRLQQLFDIIAHRFGADCKLSNLTNDVLLEYGEQLSTEGLSGSTINKRFAMINILFSEAIKWNKYSGYQPVKVRYKTNGPRKRVITPQEQSKAISIFKSMGTPFGDAMADLVIILADTGMRLSEALKLKKSYFFPEQKSVLITDTLNGEDRLMPLTERSLNILLERSKQGHQTLLYPLTVPTTADHMWAKARKQMGLENDTEFLLSSFRNTFINTLVDVGISFLVIKKAIGHKTIVSTERYVDISSEALKGLESVIEERNNDHMDFAI